jgi:hypothetical protein
MLDLRTPSSPYSTSWSTISATTGGQKEDPLPKHPSPRARSLLWPSSLVGGASPARGLLPFYAQTGLRGAFRTLPDRSRFDRLVRSQVGLIEEVASYLAAEAMGNEEGL